VINIIINNINMASTRISEDGVTKAPLNVLTEPNLDSFGVREGGTETDIPTVYSISSEHTGH
jgi:hypothetical protein